MDIIQNKLTNNAWDLEKTMDGQILHDPLLCDLVWPNYSLQTHQISLSSHVPTSSFPSDQGGSHIEEEEPEEELGAMKEMMYKIAAMQPVDIDPATIQKPKRRNVRISEDPQSVAARHRRERISERIRILQRLVPGGTKMDTASMLDEAIRYVKFLKRQVHELQSNQNSQIIGAPRCLTTGDWPVISNKALASTNPSFVKPPVGVGFAFGGSDTLCFNHEVTSD